MKHTPWGSPQTQHELAPGITSVTTSRHGGIHLTAQRLEAMPAALRSVNPFAGEGWYEEDIDWAIVALAFPEAFTPEERGAAKRTIASWDAPYLKPAREWLESQP